jgi:hypothetical protein
LLLRDVDRDYPVSSQGRQQAYIRALPSPFILTVPTEKTANALHLAYPGSGSTSKALSTQS